MLQCGIYMCYIPPLTTIPSQVDAPRTRQTRRRRVDVGCYGTSRDQTFSLSLEVSALSHLTIMCKLLRKDYLFAQKDINSCNKSIEMSRWMYKMRREQGLARENEHVMRLPAEQLKVKCRVSLAVLGHRTEAQANWIRNVSCSGALSGNRGRAYGIIAADAHDQTGASRPPPRNITTICYQKDRGFIEALCIERASFPIS